MPQTAHKFETLINKYKSRDLTKVADYLISIGRRSKETTYAYSHAIDHLNKFIEQNYNGRYNVQTILDQKDQKIDVYDLLNRFISYLQNDTKNSRDLNALTVRLYITAAKSYLAYNDIEITQTRFKNKVKLPVVYREDEEAIDANDIREILQKCNNRRLKAYLLVLASGGMRAVEALAIRLRDLDTSHGKPTQVRIRKEFAKTRRERHIFISDEATDYLNQWIEWKYRDRHKENKQLQNKIKNDDDLVFGYQSSRDPHGIYFKMLTEFQKLLDTITELNGRKEGGVNHRRKITFHSFRRFVKTVIANQDSTDYSEWFLGHSAVSTYYRNKPDELRKIYKDKLMKYLTFLDYSTVEATGQSYAAKLEEKEAQINAQQKEIEQLRRRDTSNAEAITKLQEQLTQLYDELSKRKIIGSISASPDKKERQKFQQRQQELEQYYQACSRITCSTDMTQEQKEKAILKIPRPRSLDEEHEEEDYFVYDYNGEEKIEVKKRKSKT